MVPEPVEWVVPELVEWVVPEPVEWAPSEWGSPRTAPPFDSGRFAPDAQGPSTFFQTEIWA